MPPCCARLSRLCGISPAGGVLFGVLVLVGATGVEGVEPGPARVVGCGCGGLIVVCAASAGWVAAVVPVVMVVVVATGCVGKDDDDDKVLSVCC